MSAFSITAQQVKAKAEELTSLNANFKTSVSNLEADEQTLAGMWDGDAKDAFHSAFNKDKIQMTNFSTLIDKYVTALQTIVAKYEQAESQNVETASQRNY